MKPQKQMTADSADFEQILGGPAPKQAPPARERPTPAPEPADAFPADFKAAHAMLRAYPDPECGPAGKVRMLARAKLVRPRIQAWPPLYPGLRR